MVWEVADLIALEEDDGGSDDFLRKTEEDTGGLC